MKRYIKSDTTSETIDKYIGKDVWVSGEYCRYHPEPGYFKFLSIDGDKCDCYFIASNDYLPLNEVRINNSCYVFDISAITLTNEILTTEELIERINNPDLSPSEYIRRNYKTGCKGMQTYIIDGVPITTNLISDIQYWNGSSTPRGYESFGQIGGTYNTIYEAFDDLVAKGYTNIKFLYVSTTIRGFTNCYVFAKK